MPDAESPIGRENLDESYLPELLSPCFEALFEKDRLSHMAKFIRGLIHNINGPLQNMSMLAELLMRGQQQIDQVVRDPAHISPDEWADMDEKQRYRLNLIIQQITSLAEMLRDFMVMQDIEHNASEVDLKMILGTLARVFRADLFCKHYVQVELQLADNLPIVRIRGRDLMPALMHLFRNALTAVRESPEKKITIQTNVEDEHVRIVFRDTGCGLSSDLDAKAHFDPFFSAWPQTAVEKVVPEKLFGFGLFAVRELLGPYGVKVNLNRSGEETLAILEIPIVS